MLRGAKVGGAWPDWTLWNEPWIPAAVYFAISVALGVLVFRRPTVRRFVRTVCGSFVPLLAVGTAVVVVGSASALRTGSDFARVATVACGTLMLLAHYILPRLKGLRWRDVEILLVASEVARSVGDEERADDALRAVAQRVSVDLRTEGAQAQSPTGMGTQWVRRWLASAGDTPISDVLSDGSRQFEARVFGALRSVQGPDSVAEVRGRPWDAEVRLDDGQRLAVDVRAGSQFSARNALQRTVGEYFLMAESSRPAAIMLVVRAAEDQPGLLALERAFGQASLSLPLSVVGLPDSNTAAQDEESLRGAIAAARQELRRRR